MERGIKMAGIRILVSDLRVDQVIPNRIYNLEEVALILCLKKGALKQRIREKRLKPISRKKWDHYKIFGSELKRYLKYSEEYEIESY